MSDFKESFCGFSFMDVGRFDVYVLFFFNFLCIEFGIVSVVLKMNVCWLSICFGCRVNIFCLLFFFVFLANVFVVFVVSRFTLVSFAALFGCLMCGGCGMFWMMFVSLLKWFCFIIWLVLLRMKNESVLSLVKCLWLFCIVFYIRLGVATMIVGFLFKSCFCFFFDILLMIGYMLIFVYIVIVCIMV